MFTQTFVMEILGKMCSVDLALFRLQIQKIAMKIYFRVIIQKNTSEHV